MQKRAAGAFYLPYSFMGNSCNFFTCNYIMMILFLQNMIIFD